MSEQNSLSVEQTDKLSEIFMPYFLAERKKRFGSEYSRNSRFVHYTSADAAIQIIRKKRLWMRNATCMNDYREVVHGYDIVDSFFFSKGPNRDKFQAALDECAPGVYAKIDGFFQHSRRRLLASTYIASISVHEDEDDQHGRLSMWRGFGFLAGPRVALVIDVPAQSESLSALNLIFSPVAYLSPKAVNGWFLAIAENVNTNREFLHSLEAKTVFAYTSAMLLSAITCLKHEGFKEEREWRALYFPSLNESHLMESSIETVWGVPQRIFKIPMESNIDPGLKDLDLSRLVDRVIIGPTQFGMAIKDAFVDELNQLGVSTPDKRVFLSEIPLRS